MALLATACPQPSGPDNPSPNPGPTLNNDVLDLNTDPQNPLKVTLVYLSGTDVTKIKDAAAVFRDNANSAGTQANMLERAGDYKIIVEYADAGVAEYTGLVPSDGQTIKVHYTWLSSDGATISPARFSNAFNNMLSNFPAVVQPNMIYNRATNTITIVKANARSNHGTAKVAGTDLVWCTITPNDTTYSAHTAMSTTDQAEMYAPNPCA